MAEQESTSPRENWTPVEQQLDEMLQNGFAMRLAYKAFQDGIFSSAIAEHAPPTAFQEDSEIAIESFDATYARQLQRKSDRMFRYSEKLLDRAIRISEQQKE